VSPVKYELGFISQKTTFFIVTAVKTSSLTFNTVAGNGAILREKYSFGVGGVSVQSRRILCDFRFNERRNLIITNVHRPNVIRQNVARFVHVQKHAGAHRDVSRGRETAPQR
jgi:hypothetical protein